MTSPPPRPIPRIIHWLWLGPRDIPELFDHYLESWRIHHPSWETRLWRDDNLPPLSVQSVLDASSSFKARYDIVRLELLRQFGGVICDLDVEAIRPIDPLLTNVEAFAGAIAGGHVGNQVLGAIPHHPFFERAVERMNSGVPTEESASAFAGKSFLKRLLLESPGALTIFPPETFHYEPSFDPPKRPEDFPGVYAVHHQLESYAEAVSPEFVGSLLARIVEQTDRVRGARELLSPGNDDAAAVLDDVRERLLSIERKLRRAASRQERAQMAQRQQLAALGEQALTRLARAERLSRSRIGELESQRSAAERTAPPEGVATTIRRWLAGLRSPRL